MQGCYIGAETLAKVANMDAVKQQLWGLQLSGSACKGDTIEGIYTKCNGRVKANWSFIMRCNPYCPGRLQFARMQMRAAQALVQSQALLKALRLGTSDARAGDNSLLWRASR